MKKFLTVLGSCALLFTLALPSFAAGSYIDYNDYVTDIVVDGSNDLVTVTLPVSDAEMYLYSNELIIASGFGNSLEYNFEANTSYSLQFRVLNEGMKISNIPDDTLVHFRFGCDDTDTNNIETSGFMASNAVYADGQGNLVSKPMTQLEYALGSLSWLESEFYLENDGTYEAVYFHVNTDSFSYPTSGIRGFYVDQLQLKMSISSLYRQQQQNNTTNNLLTEVEKQLKEQGVKLDDLIDQQQQTNDKLDEIIDRPISGSPPTGSDKVEELDRIESGLRADAQSGLDTALQTQTSARDVLVNYAVGFLAASFIFEKFSTIPFFEALVTVSISVGLVAALFGLVSAIGSSSNKGRHENRPKRRKGGDD